MMRSLMHAAHTTPDLMRALREVFIEPERLDLQKMLRRAVARGEELARSARADVIVMDIRMPDLDGLQATRLITADDDLAGVRILILTTFELDEYVLRALRAGAGCSTAAIRAITCCGCTADLFACQPDEHQPGTQQSLSRPAPAVARVSLAL